MATVLRLFTKQCRTDFREREILSSSGSARFDNNPYGGGFLGVWANRRIYERRRPVTIWVGSGAARQSGDGDDLE